jgi:transcriptional regulator with XRE-family HTH domain
MNVTKGRRRDAKEAVKKELGERIVRARERRGWSQKELASRLEIPRERLGAWERGRNAPGVEDLSPLSEVLGVPFEELLGGRRTEAPPLSASALEGLAIQVVSMAQTLKPWVRLVQATTERSARKRS